MRILELQGISALLLVSACGAGVPEAGEVSGEHAAQLIGGRLATEAEYPSTIYINGTCTATKVGSHHFLTASHCVLLFNGFEPQLDMKQQFQPGGEIQITDDNRGLHPRPVTVTNTSVVSPHYYETGPVSPPFPDAAVVRILEDTPEISIAVVDTETVLVGDQVVKTGYGCDGASNVAKFKLQEVTVPTTSPPDHSWLQSFVRTERLEATPGGAALCPGDSGGPLYRQSSSELVVVGINALGGGDSDHHTRLDSGSLYAVHDWVKTTGARVRRPSSATPFGGVPISAVADIQAEDFDLGEADVAYHDSTVANDGGLYRPSASPDIYAASDALNGHFVRASAGEWLRFSVSAPAGVEYDLELRLAGVPSPNALRVELDEQEASGAVAMPPEIFGTPGWQTLTVPKLALTPGRNVLRLHFLADVEVDSFRFTPRPLPTCSDDIKNGTETDVDCGGHICGGCAPDASCLVNADCASALCREQLCRDTVQEIASGEFVECARFSSGNVRCWGHNDRGRLGIATTAGNIGDGPGEIGPGMVAVPLSGPATTLDLGLAHGCAVLESGAVECWGANDKGQLGAGDTLDRIDSVVQPDLGGPAVSVSLGAAFSCALMTSGQVKCWGANQAGQLGIGSKLTIGDQPGEMGSALAAVGLPSHPLQISAGTDHVCAMYFGEGIRCWGIALNGELGFNAGSAYGDASTELSPPLVNLGSGFSPQRVAAGAQHTCALSFGGTIKCWGSSFWGQLGYGDTVSRGRSPSTMGDNLPTVPTGGFVSALSVGMHTTCVMQGGGRVKCWGLGGHLGQPTLTSYDIIGDQPGEVSPSLPYVDLGTSVRLRSLSTSGSTFCGLLTDQDVKCWGHNWFGELGLGDNAIRGDEVADMGDNLPRLPLY